MLRSGLGGNKKEYAAGEYLQTIVDSSKAFAECVKCGSETNFDKIVARVDAKTKKMKQLSGKGKDENGNPAPLRCKSKECGERVYVALKGTTIYTFNQRLDLIPLIGSKKPLGFHDEAYAQEAQRAIEKLQ